MKYRILQTICLVLTIQKIIAFGDDYSDNDPKDNYFGYIRSINANPRNIKTEDKSTFRDVPQPGGFQRHKRDVDNLQEESKNNASCMDDEKKSEQPLEVDSLQSNETRTAKMDQEPFIEPREDKTSTAVPINDFIRFRRNTKNRSDLEDTQMLLEAENYTHQNGNEREARGATKEEWTKQPYPVQRNDYSNDVVRAPRVHFVTQKRTIGEPYYEREARSKEPPPNDNILSRDIYFRERELPNDFGRYERLPRRYETPPRFERFREEPYPYDRDPRDQYNYRNDRGYDSRDRYNSNPVMPRPRQRIIYYANLPEITRSPPSVDFRDRYRFRDEDPYPNAPYRGTGKLYPSKPDRTKSGYPYKVSTDVNVKEIKKNPERRIYAEVDRRYAHKSDGFGANSDRQQ